MEQLIQPKRSKQLHPKEISLIRVAITVVYMSIHNTSCYYIFVYTLFSIMIEKTITKTNISVSLTSTHI